MLVLLLVGMSGKAMFSSAVASTYAESVTHDVYAVVHNMTLATGNFESGQVYYTYETIGYEELSWTDYTIGEPVNEYMVDVYVKSDTYSVLKKDGATYTTLYDSITTLGRSDAMDTYVDDYAMLAIVSTATSEHIDIHFGLGVRGLSIYGILETSSYMYFSSDYSFYIYGEIEFNNRDNTSAYAIYLSEGSLYCYASIVSIDKTAIVSNSSGVLEIYNEIVSNGDKTIHIPSSTYTTAAAAIYSNVSNSGEGYAILNESSRDVYIYGGIITSGNNTIHNASTGDIYVTSSTTRVVIASGNNAIYNTLSADITIEEDSETLDIISTGSNTIYLNKGNLSITGGNLENTTDSSNIIYAANNGMSSVVDVVGSTFTMTDTATGYAIYNNSVDGSHYGQVYLAGDITHSANKFIYTRNYNSINAVSYSDSTLKYSGDVITIHCYGGSGGNLGDTDIGSVVVKSVDSSNKELFTLAGSNNYALTTNGDNNLEICYVYRVTYLPNGADGGITPIDKVAYASGDEATVLDTDITRVGYNFAGWTSDNIVYAPGDSVPVTKNITFTAKWTEKTYTITYVHDTDIVHTDTYTISTTNYRVYAGLDSAGYTAYWTASGTDINGWDSETHYTDTITMNRWYGDVTMTAHLEIETYSIKFVSDGTEIEDYSTTYNVLSDDLTFSYTLDKSGYHFFGWREGAYGTPSTTVTIPTGSTGDKVFTAHFEEKTYTYYIVNLDSKYYAYSYTKQNTVYDIALLGNMSDAIASIDADRYETSYIDATLYLGANESSLVIENDESIVLQNGKYDVTAYVVFSYPTPTSAVATTYSQNIGGQHSTYNIVMLTQVTLRLNRFVSNNNTSLHVAEGASVSLYAYSMSVGSASEYNAIYNLGTLDTITNLTITKGSIYNLGTLNVRSTITISKTNYIYNGGKIEFFDKGHISQENATFMYSAGMIDNYSINNNGIIELYPTTTISNTVITRVRDDSLYVDMPEDYTSTIKIVIMMLTYAYSKVIDTNQDVDTVSLVGVVENNALKNDFVITQGVGGLYVNKIYTITYDFNQGVYNDTTTTFSVVDRDSYIVISQNNITRDGYSFDGIYRVVGGKYVDTLGGMYDSLYDESLVIDNAWQEIVSVREYYHFIVRWQINAPKVADNAVYISSTTFNGNNYIYVDITNQSTDDGVEYNYQWYHSATYGGDYTLKGSTDIPRLSLTDMSDSGYYYATVTVTDGVSTKSTTTGKKLFTIRKAEITFDAVSYSSPYDGEYHSILVDNITTVEGYSYNITYSLDQVTYVSTNYTFKDYTSGSVTVYFRIQADKHNDIEGSAAVTITKVDITITANDETSVYGEAIKPVSCAVTSGRLVNATDLGSIWAETTADRLSAGTYDIVPKYFENANYNVTVVSGTYEVSKKPLVIKVNDVSITYGDTIESYEYDITGFILGDSEENLIGEIDFTTTYTSRSQVGTYDVIATGYSATNYDITYEKGTITVGKADITYSVNNYSGVYDNRYHTILVHTIGVVNNLDYTIKYSIDGGHKFNESSAQLFKNVVSSIDVWFKITASNHNEVIDKGVVSISKRAITITLDDITTKYMESAKPLTYAVTSGSLADGETLKTLGVTVTREEGYMPGTYRITATHTTTNYDITYVEGRYVINAVDLVSSDGYLVLTAESGLNPNMTLVSTNTYKEEYKAIDTSSVAGEHSEIIQAVTLSMLDEHGDPYTLPTKSYTIKLLIAEEYRDRENYKVVCNYNASMLVVLRAEREGDYLVFSTSMIGEYFVIANMEKDYAIVPIIFASIVLIALVVLYILMCTKYKHTEIRIMSFGGVILMVYVPMLSKAILVSLLMLIIFMIFVIAIKFMSYISVDIESLKTKEKKVLAKDTIDHVSQEVKATDEASVSTENTVVDAVDTVDEDITSFSVSNEDDSDALHKDTDSIE